MASEINVYPELIDKISAIMKLSAGASMTLNIYAMVSAGVYVLAFTHVFTSSAIKTWILKDDSSRILTDKVKLEVVTDASTSGTFKIVCGFNKGG